MVVTSSHLTNNHPIELARKQILAFMFHVFQGATDARTSLSFLPSYAIEFFRMTPILPMLLCHEPGHPPLIPHPLNPFNGWLLLYGEEYLTSLSHTL